MPIDVSLPGGLSFALAPDLLLIGGAMLLMLWSAWRPDSAAHQRSVGIGSLVLTVITAGVVIWFAMSGRTDCNTPWVAGDGLGGMTSG
jgi:hypothetical protein